MNGLLSRIRAALSRRAAPSAPSPGPDDERARAVAARLAAGVAHDLNNILLVLQGYSEMAVEEPDSSPGVRALLDEMRNATVRASLLVKDLQVLGERGQGASRLIDVSETVRRSFPSLRAPCPAGVEIRLSLAGGLPQVRADEELVARVLAALCSRARESMPAGGTIEVSTSAAETGQHAVSLTVADTGTALTDEMRSGLFEPYSPGPGGTKGQGLGMAVVQAAARRLGGEVLVRSGPGGTAIELRLPRGEPSAVEPPKAEAPRAAVAAAAARPRPVPGTILVAEDDEGLRALAVKVLSREGFRVLAARDGQEAVELFAREAAAVRLALLDDVMPRLGGRAALDRIHALSPRLPAILCSGYTWRLDADSPESAGRCQVLQKPWQPRDLLRKVHEGLEQAP